MSCLKDLRAHVMSWEMEILHYTEWRDFLKVPDKAKIACETAGEKAFDHFVDINEMIESGKNAERTVDDIALTRYACYLVAQNGDPAKPAVFFASTIIQRSEKCF